MAISTPEIVTRFAPSPSGLLHLGHAYSALFAWRQARERGGVFLLRIEDIDEARCKKEFESAILEDLSWLGLSWPEPPRRQSERLQRYADALSRLEAAALIYPCFCTRKEIQSEIAKAASAPHGPDGPLYPGTCRKLSPEERGRRFKAGLPYALRLDMQSAVKMAGPLEWHDLEAGSQRARPEVFGDIVLARKDIATSYHLAVTLDDAEQGVTLVTRGKDLFEASHIHRLLQTLLALPVPLWHHHSLLTDENGKRLAKRHDSLSLRALRADGKSAEEVRALAGFPGLF